MNSSTDGEHLLSQRRLPGRERPHAITGPLIIVAVFCLTVGLTLAGCTLFRPEWTESVQYQPVQSEFRLRKNSPTALGLIDTSAVYVERENFVRQGSPGEVPHYRYLRFSRTGKVFLSRYYYPDSVNIQQVLYTGETGRYGYWTDVRHESASPVEMSIQMEFYADALYLFTLRHAHVYEDSIVVYKEEARRLFGFDNDEHIVYQKQTDIRPLPPLRWPE